MEASKKTSIFIAYSRKDESFLRELRVFLHPLEQNKQVEIWYDGEIVAGEVWENSIKTALHQADIILLLVSANALASDYFYENEVKDALERHRNKTCTVIPVILKPCGWEDTALSNLQALPKDGEPITLWPNSDQAYKSVFDGIKAAIAKIQTPPPPTTPPVAPKPTTPKPTTTRKTTEVQIEKTVTTSTSNGFSWVWGLLLAGVLIAVYFLFIRPQKKDPDPVPLPVFNRDNTAQEIKDGVGFGDIEVGKTSLEKIKQRYGSSFVTKVFAPQSVMVSYPDKGIDFYFDHAEYNAVKPESLKKVKSIAVKQPFKGRTTPGGIILGYSSMANVVNIYGKAEWLSAVGSDVWKLEYAQEGMRFGTARDKSLPQFPLNKEAHMKRTVDIIEVFEPTKK